MEDTSKDKPPIPWPANDDVTEVSEPSYTTDLPPAQAEEIERRIAAKQPKTRPK